MSWHNDVSPSFTFKAGSQYLVLVVDYEEPDSRELAQECYLVMTAINEGSEADQTEPPALKAMASGLRAWVCYSFGLADLHPCKFILAR